MSDVLVKPSPEDLHREGRGKPLDAESAGPIVVEILGDGLCPAVGNVWLMIIKSFW
jgi:hypothetical protein